MYIRDIQLKFVYSQNKELSCSWIITDLCFHDLRSTVKNLCTLLLHACMLSHFNHVQLFVNLWTIYNLSGSSVHGILQARILNWIAVPSSRGSSQHKDQSSVPHVSSIGRWVLYHYCHLGSPMDCINLFLNV